MSALVRRVGPEPETTPTINVAPHNMEAEQALLGVLLYDNAAYERLTDALANPPGYISFAPNISYRKLHCRRRLRVDGMLGHSERFSTRQSW